MKNEIEGHPIYGTVTPSKPKEDDSLGGCRGIFYGLGLAAIVWSIIGGLLLLAHAAGIF